MKTWNDFLEEPIDANFSERIFKAVAPELEINRSQSKARGVGRRSWIFSGLGLLSALGVGAFIFRGLRPAALEPDQLLIADTLAENDFDLIENLDLIDDLEVLEQWES